ncbi:L-2-hydroxyglutarate oxidase [Conexibacter arvalis]|uniref:2-hydroxyglutarate dehydrogenase n=1 Tax=Conexibacter arvalis TaxID=912552 RepID=A0A840IG52_9ACTN|nr:L-2-hydroxyglutarate oxidase [Conexibacter arvalis]MBB4663789.1 2-hydroxyglutarate dehydrogenase [Conexibacter arvalis]
MTATTDTTSTTDTTGLHGAHDLVVVGAGIVGLAVARELLHRHPRLKLVVVDKEQQVGRHQTGHNSGVIHAGIYYQPGSLKARLCVEGAAALFDYCERKEIAFDRCGKVIVALSDAELGRLDELERRGRANGVPGLRRLDAAGLREVEPHAAGVAALHSPNTAIVDFPAVARGLADDVVAAGGRLALGREVTGVERGSGGGVVLRDADGGGIGARRVVFCAGLWADRLARAAGADPDPRIVPFRGQYMTLAPQARSLVKGLIYPVPDPSLPFLGVHLTKHVSGEVWAGPSALLVGARDAYRLGRLRGADLADTLGWPGTWRVMARYWRSGLDEIRLAASRAAFARACAQYVPQLRPEDLLPGQAGVRAQAVSRDGRLVDDFVFSDAPGELHVRNAPSPAATSALAIAGMIADRAEEALSLAR